VMRIRILNTVLKIKTEKQYINKKRFP